MIRPRRRPAPSPFARFPSLLLAPALLLALGPLACGSGESTQGAEPAAAPETRPSGPPRVLLLISVDTLRADHLGAYGHDLGLTPNLDALAAESVQFRVAFAPAPFTLPSVASLLTGRYPEELGIRSNRSAVPAGVSTLAGELGAAGWATGAVVSNFVLRRGSGLEAGFDVFDDELKQKEATRQWPERTAGPTTDAALRVLDGLDAERDRFLWVHYQDPHGPYTPPEGLREKFLDAERERRNGQRLLPEKPGRAGRGAIPTYQFLDGQREVAFYRAGYDGEIHHVDAEIGRLLAAVDERGLRDRTTIVFTADHGEALGEGDFWFAHGEELTDPLVRVPLLVRAPDLVPGRRGDVASLVDVYPTLLRLVEDRRVGDDFLGRDLLQNAREEGVAYLTTLAGGSKRRYGLAKGPHKLVVSFDEPARLWQRDRKTKQERPARRGYVQAAMNTAVAKFREDLPVADETRRQQTKSDEDALRALGYVEDEPKG